MSILIVAEKAGEELTAGTLATIAAANEIEQDLHVLVTGANLDGPCEQAGKLNGVTKVFKGEDEAYEHGIAENLGPLIEKLAGDYSHIFAPASFFGKNLMPRVAARQDVQQISDITEVKSAESFVRPIYAGNALAHVTSQDNLKIVTVRGTAFDPAEEGGEAAPVEEIETTGDAGKVEFVDEELTESDRPELATASIVISGGRGMGSGEAFQHLEKVADKLGAAIGASRAAVDAGYVPNDYQVGQTGKVVAPDLYIAVGISGAIQHLAGMKDSKYIVAINKDEDAPIFQVADYGLVADLFEALPELEQKL